MPATQPAYVFQDIVNAYATLDLNEGDIVLVRSDLSRLHSYEDTSRLAVLSAHYKVLRSLVGEKGTIVVPAGNLRLCNTDIVYDINKTPSSNLGVFSEYIRQMDGSRRRFHPYISHAAIGPHATDITSCVSRQAYGPGTSKDCLIELGARCISIGLPPELTCSVVHHAEQLIGVPYRYTKEFLQPVNREGSISIEPFYMFVTRMDLELKRGGNKKIIEHFKKNYTIQQTHLGAGHVYAYDLAQLHRSTLDLLTQDIYAWLSEPPEDRPYQT